MRPDLDDATEIAAHCAAIRRVLRYHRDDIPNVEINAEPALKALEMTALEIAGQQVLKNSNRAN